MKPGERFQLRNCPEHRGTVTNVYPNGDFRVTYDDPERRRGDPRTRVTFKSYQEDLFVPEGSIEIRIIDSDEDLPGNDILDKLLLRYGISSR